MVYEVKRDFRGYGATPPDPRWPGGARVAVNFVINYEEGSELSYPDGDGVSEWGVSDSTGQAAALGAIWRRRACSNTARGWGSGGCGGCSSSVA